MLLSRQPGKKDLWLRLKRYHFDNLVPPHLMDHVTAVFGRTDASTQAFASKLGRKLGWSTAFARRAIEEYRKFVYLGMVGEFAVTPPKVIDQVWHEHLLFSRAYREFCKNVLQREFDHNPELVPTKAQTAVFSGQYEATLRLYALEFNVLPPEDIWGTPKFAAEFIPKAKPRKRKRGSDNTSSSGDGGDSAPLFILFDGSDGYGSADSMAEFGGGGGFSGGGGGDSWGDSPSDSTDAGSSDSGGSDGGGGDGGGSGCSSGCGGGGCSSD
jgi:uncharacterized membrane protein YgcG